MYNPDDDDVGDEEYLSRSSDMKPRDPEKTAGASVTAAVQRNEAVCPPDARYSSGFAPVEVDDLPF